MWLVSLFENHVDAEDCGHDKHADGIVGWYIFGDLQHVIVSTSEELAANTGPFLRNLGDLDFPRHESVFQCSPFAF